MSRLRFLTAGESHGKAEVTIIEGIPAGLAISKEDIQKDLARRAHDFGRGGRSKIETDEVEILTGVRHGKTLGSPITLQVTNKDFKNWTYAMTPDPKSDGIDEKRVTKPRPGHADLVGILKYGFTDVRNVLERASARETVMRVAAGSIFRKLLSELGISIASHTVQIGNIHIAASNYSFDEVQNAHTTDPDVNCIDDVAREKMKKRILDARMNKDTLGGIVEVIAHGVPIGLGSYVHFDTKLDGRIAGALMSIQSVKAVEIGNAIQAAKKTGKEVQDAIFEKNGKLKRNTNNMGGLEGGVTNGEDIIVRVYHKPLSTVYDPLPTIDIETKKATVATIERSDVCVVARAGVVSESMLAFVLADAALEKFGGDSVQELQRNFNSYIRSLSISV